MGAENFGYWTKITLLIVTAVYTEAYKMQTTGSVRPKRDLHWSTKVFSKMPSVWFLTDLH